MWRTRGVYAGVAARTVSATGAAPGQEPNPRGAGGPPPPPPGLGQRRGRPKPLKRLNTFSVSGPGWEEPLWSQLI